MSRERFEADHKDEWTELEKELFALDRGRRPAAPATFLSLYRAVCQHLAIARHRHYGNDLIERLNDLALRGHTHLYKRRLGTLNRFWEYALFGFAQDVRRHSRYVAVATVLFAGPFLLMIAAIQAWPDLVHTILPPEAIAEMEAMYEPSSNERHAAQRGSDDNVYMMAHYIWNNVGIGFRTYASGIAFGLGSLFFLLFNGFFIGAAAGHVTYMGYGEPFWSFVIGHGAFELTAIVLAGAAGFKVGFSLLAPGQRSRARALAEEARDSVGLVYGFGSMLVIAAFLEAFWSPATFVPVETKFQVGAALWALVIGYFIFAGRRRGP